MSSRVFWGVLLGAIAICAFSSPKQDKATTAASSTESNPALPDSKESTSEISSPTYFPHGTNVIMTGDSIGCADLDDLGAIKDAVIDQDDKVAAVKIAIAKNCPLKRKNSKGIVSDTSFMRSAVCIHFRGDPGCLWIPNAALREN